MALKLRERIEEFGEFKGLAEEIEASNLEEAAQVETTLSNLGHMDLSTDPEAARLRVLTEIGRLRVTRHKLRDRQEMAFLRISRHHNRLNEIAKPLLYDPLTELRSRIGLETQLWEWWQEGRHQSREMAAALFDLDQFGHINESYGAAVGDCISLPTRPNAPRNDRPG